MDLGPVPQCTLEKYRSECAGLMNIKCFGATAESGKNFSVFDRNCFGRDTPPGARKRRWASKSLWCAGILIDTRFADMPYARCEQVLYYGRRLRDATDANMDITEKDSRLRC